MKLCSLVRVATLVAGLLTTACAEEGSPNVPELKESAIAAPELSLTSAMAEDARVLMLSPQDGEIVSGPLVEGHIAIAVMMGLEGARVAPAGHMEDGTGHHHLIVDAGPVPEGEPVPFDAQHLHFGKGQTSAEVLLTPGHHTLTLQFADGAHRSYGPALATSVEIWVEARA